MKIRVKRQKSGAIHSFKIPSQKQGEEAMNVHIMEAGQSHRENNNHPLQIVLIFGEINVCGQILNQMGQCVDIPRRTFLSIDTHTPCAYTVQVVHRRDNAAPD